MSYLGTKKIGKMYLGSTEIAKAYLGITQVFSKESIPEDGFLEYIILRDGSWLNTGIKSSKNLTLDVTFMPQGDDANWRTLLGCRNGNSTRDYSVAFGTDQNAWSVIYLGLSSNSNSTNVTSSLLFPIKENKIRLIKDTSNNATFYKNDVQVFNSTFRQTSTIASENIYVGAYNDYGAGEAEECFPGRLYDLNLGGVTFSPYRKNGVAGLLRIDNNIFLPSEGNADFLAGPLIVI